MLANVAQYPLIFWPMFVLVAVALVVLIYWGLNPALNAIFKPRKQFHTVADRLQPYRFEEDEQGRAVLLTKANRFVVMFELQGYDYATNSGMGDVLANKRARLFTDAARLDVSVKTHIRMRKIKPPRPVNQTNDVLKALDTQWGLTHTEHFDPRYFMILEVNNTEDARRNLDHFIIQLTQQVQELKAVRMNADEMAEYMADLVNARTTHIDINSDDLSYDLATASVFMDEKQGLVTIGDGPDSSYQVILNVEQWGEQVHPRLIANLATSLVDMDIQVTARPQTPLTAKTLSGYRKTFSQFAGSKTQQEIDDIRDKLADSTTAVFATQVTVTLTATSKEQLKAEIDLCRQHFGKAGITPVVETRGLMASWFNRVPGHTHLIRLRTLTSQALAAIADFPLVYRGLEDSGFGPGAIQIYPTPNRVPTRFQFHSEPKPDALGHTVMFAPTGGGKSTMMQHLMAGTLRYDEVDVYAFDRKHGLYIGTQAMGGTHYDFDTGAGLNPFALPDTPANRTFLISFLCSMAGYHDPTPAQEREASDAVEMAYGFSIETRTLAQFHSTAFAMGSPFSDALAKWVRPESPQFGWFNAKSDDLADIDGALHTFEMETPFQNAQAGALLTRLIMHRIRQRSEQTGRHHLIIIDEAAALMKERGFANHVAQILREHRKLGGVAVLAFQDVHGMFANPETASAILGNTSNQIFFRNGRAKAADFKDRYDINPEQLQAIQGLSGQGAYTVLFRTDDGGHQATRYLETDLSTLNDYRDEQGRQIPLLNLFSSSQEHRRLAQAYVQAGGEDWLTWAINPRAETDRQLTALEDPDFAEPVDALPAIQAEDGAQPSSSEAPSSVIHEGAGELGQPPQDDATLEQESEIEASIGEYRPTERPVAGIDDDLAGEEQPSFEDEDAALVELPDLPDNQPLPATTQGTAL